MIPLAANQVTKEYYLQQFSLLFFSQRVYFMEQPELQKMISQVVIQDQTFY